MKKPKNFYCHLPDQQTKIANCKLPNLQVIDKIGEGSFGLVYKVFDPKTSKLMVVKKCKNQTQLGLTEEDSVLKEMSTSEGFNQLRVQTYSSSPQDLYMECLGPSLGTVMRKTKKINTYSMKRIARQIIYRLKQLHSHNFVHRDLKPDNILLGNLNEPHTIYLIDFGLTTTFKKKSTKQRKMYEGVIGTLKFCPLASHEGFEQYPKDDLESVGYILTYLVCGNLPWGNFPLENDQTLHKKIKKSKEQSSLQELSGGLNCLRNYYTKVRSLKIGQKINYLQFIDLFEVQNDDETFCFDFCETVRGKCNNSLSHTQKDKNHEIQMECKAKIIRGSILM